MPDSIARTAYKSVAYNYIGKFLCCGFSLLITIYIIKQLNVSDYGIYNMLTGLVSFALIFSSFGMPGVLERYVPEYYERKEYGIIKKIVYGSIILRFVTGLGFILVVLFLRNFFIIHLHIRKEIVDYLGLFSIVIIAYLESQLIGDAVLVPLLEQKYWNIARTIYFGLKFIFYFLVLKIGYGLIGIIYCWIIVEVLLFLLYGYKFISIFIDKKGTGTKVPLRRMIRYGSFFFVKDIGYSFLYYNTDNYIIAYFMSTVAVGYYSFATKISESIILWSPSAVILPVLIPIFIRKYTQNSDKKELLGLFTLFNKILFFSGIPMIIIIMILSDKIIMIVFKMEYIGITPLLIFMLLISCIKIFMKALHPLIRTLERSEIYLLDIFFASYNFILDILLIPKYGIWGAAIATGSAELLLFLSQFIMIKRHIDLYYPWKSFMKMSVNLALMGIILIVLKPLIQNLFGLILITVIVLLSYLLISYFNKGFDSNERKLLNKAIGKKLFVF